MDEIGLLLNESATFVEVAANGSASSPSQFPPPTIGHGIRVKAPIHAGKRDVEGHVVYEIQKSSRRGSDRGSTTNSTVTSGASSALSGASSASPVPRSTGSLPSVRPERGYWVGRVLRETKYGYVKYCAVVRLRPDASWDGPGSKGVWEPTGEDAVVKISHRAYEDKWKRASRAGEDPVREVAAAQFITRDGPHPNFLGLLDVLRDRRYLYTFMPFWPGGELFSHLSSMNENLARHCFRQILEGIRHLERMGVCHRDLSLENILVDEKFNVKIIDFGMSLRVRFRDDDGNLTSNERRGELRCLMDPQGRCGKPYYISPEVLGNEVPFDGFAVDVWAAGIMLFMLLSKRYPPFELAHPDDPRFRALTTGGREKMLKHLRKKDLSIHAVDLVERMLVMDPRDRLSLVEVMDHEWLIYRDEGIPEPEKEEWKTMQSNEATAPSAAVGEKDESASVSASASGAKAGAHRTTYSTAPSSRGTTPSSRGTTPSSRGTTPSSRGTTPQSMETPRTSTNPRFSSRYSSRGGSKSGT